MVEYTAKEWAVLTAHATELGNQHGRTAATWYEIEGASAAERVLTGIDENDPAILDTFPTDPLSGKWADSYTLADLLKEIGAANDSDDGELASNFEVAFSQAAENEIYRHAAAMVQANVVINSQYVQVVDQHFRDMLAANSADPYVHSEYERHQRLAYAALVLLTNGDQDYADALAQAFHDSNEDMSWYLEKYTRRDLIRG